MSTEDEVKVTRYKEIARESDEWGRVIGVRRLKLSEQTKLLEYTPRLSGNEEVPTADGIRVAIPHRSQLMIAAAVCEIDNRPVAFARSREELDAMLDRLDNEGVMAALKAMGSLSPLKTIDDAKNLSGTPSSDSVAG